MLEALFSLSVNNSRCKVIARYFFFIQLEFRLGIHGMDVYLCSISSSIVKFRCFNPYSSQRTIIFDGKVENDSIAVATTGLEW
jgi:hypothetical protein